MKQVMFRLNDDTVIDKLDEIVKAKGYASRNDLVNEILEEYVAVGDKMFLNALPPVIHTLCTNELNRLNEQSELTIETCTLAIKRLIYSLEKFEALVNLSSDRE